MNFLRRASKLGQPLKNILLDYVEVTRDIFVELKRSPSKCMLWLMVGGVTTVCHWKCPDLSSYKHEVIEYSNELGLCAKEVRNFQSKVYIDRISTMLNDGNIRHLNLGVISVIMQRQHSSRCYNYHETCSHLQPRIWRFHEQIIDVGVWNQWLILKRTMVDFDVNENEF